MYGLVTWLKIITTICVLYHETCAYIGAGVDVGREKVYIWGSHDKEMP